VRFRYKLEGSRLGKMARSWNTPVRLSTPDLRPGKYRFRVDGVQQRRVVLERRGRNSGLQLGARLAPDLVVSWGSSLAVFLALLWALINGAFSKSNARKSKLRDVIDTIPAVGGFPVRPTGKNEWVNRRWVEYSGLSPEASSGSVLAIHGSSRRS